MSTPEVVVTGLGMTTPVGGDVASSWSAILAGQSGVRPIDAEWIAEQCELLADSNECAGIERAEVERVDVELTVEFGVSPQQDLETAIEGEAVDDVAADPPANAVGRFEHDHRAPRFVQDPGGGKAGETGTDDDDIAGLGKGRLIGHVVQARR